MNKPKVSIIILNWNNVNNTLAVLEDLKKVTYPNFSVMVVDNASKNDSIGQLARWMEQERRAEVKAPYKLSLLPLSKNFGFAESNNKGVQQAAREQPDYYLLLKNDTILQPGFLDLLVEAAESNDSIGAVSPTIQVQQAEDNKLPTVWYAGGRLNYYTGGAHRYTELPENNSEIMPTEFLTNSCLLIKRSAITKIGQLFDPTFFAYNEDVDLSLRLRQAGYQLGHVPAATIWQKRTSNTSGAQSYNVWYYTVRNNFLIMARYANWYHWPSFILYFLYQPVLLSIVETIIKPKRNNLFRLIAITHASVDAIRRHYGQRDD